MPLASDPSQTFNAQGNILPTSTALALSGVSAGNIVDFSANCLGGTVEVYAKAGAAVAATNGCKVEIFEAGSTTSYGTIASYPYTIPLAANQVQTLPIRLPTGKYSITLTNLDATNGITVGLTSNPIT